MSDGGESTWEAVRFERTMPTGRTRPLLLECAHVAGDTERRGRFVVKALGLPEITAARLCHEFLGCRLARLFGLSAPASVLVGLSPAFIQAVSFDLERERVRVSPGLAVGVEHVRNLFAFPAAATLGESEIIDAARIYAFDLAVQNPDRTKLWPNCGRGPDGLVPYDFENAFSFRYALSKPQPWQVTQLGFSHQHLFHAQLRAASVDWPGVFAPMRTVAVGDVQAVCGTIPELWRSVGVEINDHLAILIEHWPEFESEVAASVA